MWVEYWPKTQIINFNINLFDLKFLRLLWLLSDINDEMQTVSQEIGSATCCKYFKTSWGNNAFVSNK